MDQHCRWFHNEAGWRIGSKVQHNLHTYAGTHRCCGSREAAGDGAMDMPAGDSLDLRMFFNQIPEFLPSIEGFFVHVTDAGGKRWMMHENHRRRCRSFPKFPIQPIQSARS